MRLRLAGLAMGSTCWWGTRTDLEQRPRCGSRLRAWTARGLGQAPELELRRVACNMVIITLACRLYPPYTGHLEQGQP